MNDLPFHLTLFVVAGTVIVTINAMFAEPDDKRMLRSLPRRLGTFFGGCALVTVIMLILEHTVASVS